MVPVSGACVASPSASITPRSPARPVRRCSRSDGAETSTETRSGRGEPPPVGVQLPAMVSSKRSMATG